MTTVFLDTVGLLALWDRSDQWHAAATLAFARLDPRATLMVSTPYVLAECGNAAARRPYRSDVDDMRVKLEKAQLLIIPTDQDWQLAWDQFRQGHAGGAGIVDELSFAVMRRLGIDHALTNDRHFVAAGFQPLF